MKIKFIIFLSIIICLTHLRQASGQGIRGLITDTKEQPIPFSTIYIKELKRGTTSNINGEFEIKLPEGNYTLIIRNLGFKPATKKMPVNKKFVLLNVTLEEQIYQIKEVRISSKGEDPAYAIMRKAIGLAPYHLSQVKHYTAEVYLKGSIKIRKIPKIFKKAMEKEETNIRVGVTYVEESLNEIQFNAPDKYDQRVISFSTSFPENVDVNPMGFIKSSLYQPTIDMAISPLAPNAFSHYKFRYEGVTFESDYSINKIKVIPRRKSQQLFSGYIYIVDDLWNIYSADLVQETFVGPYRIKQIYSPVEEFVWLPVSHNIEVDASVIGIKINIKFAGSVKYSGITINEQLKHSVAFREIEEKYTDTVAYQTPKEQEPSKSTRKIENILNKEEMTTRDMIKLARLSKQESEKLKKKEEKTLEIEEKTTYEIEKDADKKDSIYWTRIRPVPLTKDEIFGYKIRDSVELAVSGKPDESDTTTDGKKRKAKLLESLLGGKTFYSKDSALTFHYNGLLGLNNVGFNTVDGWSFHQGFSMTKKFKSGRFYRISPTVGYAFNSKVIIWKIENQLSYAPLNRGKVFLEFGEGTNDFNSEYGMNPGLNTISSLYFRKNYIKLFEQTFLNLKNELDLANGVQLITHFNYSDRNHIENSTDFSFFYRETREYSDNLPDNPYLSDYPLYDQKSVSFTLNINYTPQYFYRVKNGVKTMVNSVYPTFRIIYTKGVKDIFQSSADFDYLEFGMDQTVDLGIFSELGWNVKTGRYLNQKHIHFPDFKHFNTQEIPVRFNGFQNAFMLLEYYRYSTPEYFIEAHLQYSTPFLVLKRLPFFSQRLWRENLYAGYLHLPDFNHYMELGYGLSDIFLVADAGIFFGFENGKYRRLGLKVNFKFGD